MLDWQSADPGGCGESPSRWRVMRDTRSSGWKAQLGRVEATGDATLVHLPRTHRHPPTAHGASAERRLYSCRHPRDHSSVRTPPPWVPTPISYPSVLGVSTPRSRMYDIGDGACPPTLPLKLVCGSGIGMSFPSIPGTMPDATLHDGYVVAICALQYLLLSSSTLAAGCPVAYSYVSQGNGRDSFQERAATRLDPQRASAQYSGLVSAPVSDAVHISACILTACTHCSVDKDGKRVNSMASCLLRICQPTTVAPTACTTSSPRLG